jgi:hypothetical protein
MAPDPGRSEAAPGNRTLVQGFAGLDLFGDEVFAWKTSDVYVQELRGQRAISGMMLVGRFSISTA